VILVIGATGNVGRELTRDLAVAGRPFRVLVRDPARAKDVPDGAERVRADLGQPATLGPAFDGIDGVFLVVPGIGLEHTEHAVAAAQAAGVSRIILISSVNVLGDPMPAMGRWHHEREELVRASGIPATILRPGGFMTNTLEWAATIRQGAYVLDPTGPGRFAPIDPADIAAVAALALSQDRHEGHAYVLTGDEVFTIAEQVAVIAATIARDIEIRETATPAEAVRARYPNGAPPALADAILEGFTLMRADTVGLRTDTVERLLGRKPGTFADWCLRNAAAFKG
jgi:uncharacterized protein YbjT (DUF2867 family)